MGFSPMNKIVLTFLVSVLPLWSANAQFVGDVFFDEPSVAARENETASLILSAFGGAHVIGAAHFQIEFDPQKLEFLGIDPIAPYDSEGALQFEYSNGVVEVISANFANSDQPLGVARMAELRLKPIGTVGDIVPINLSNIKVLLTDLTEISSGALGGEVVITAAATSMAVSADLKSTSTKVDVAEGSALDRAQRMRRPGSVVSIAQSDGRYKKVLVPIKEKQK